MQYSFSKFFRSQEWAEHSPSPAGFVYLEFSGAQPPLLHAFLFPCILGEVTPHLLSQAGVFIYSSRGKWVFPPLLWSFPPTATFTSFPAPGCWVCATAPAFSSWLVVRNFPSPPSTLRVPHPLCYVSPLLLLLIIQFLFLFSLGEGWFVQGAMLIWPRVVCGSTTVVLWSASSKAVCMLVAGGVEASWFLRLMWSGDTMHRLEVWRSQSFASSWWLFLWGVSPVSLQDFTLESMLSASSL
jgi:hypothetical protein